MDGASSPRKCASSAAYAVPASKWDASTEGRIGRLPISMPGIVTSLHDFPWLRPLDDAGVGRDPDDAGRHGRCRDRHDARERRSGRIARGRVGPRFGEIGTQLRPGRATICGRHEILIAGEQLAPAVPHREGDGRVEHAAQLERRILVRPDFYPLLPGLGNLRDAESTREDDVGIAWIGKDRTPLPAGHRLPVYGRYRPQVASTARGDRTRVLL